MRRDLADGLEFMTQVLACRLLILCVSFGGNLWNSSLRRLETFKQQVALHCNKKSLMEIPAIRSR
jgi:hypothetical protein